MGVRGGDEETSQCGEVGQEMGALSRALLRVLNLPERVRGEGGRHQRGGERERGQAWGTPRCEQQARSGLDRACDAYQLERISGEDGNPLPDRPDDGAGSLGSGLGAAQGA